jgi:pimeloyl-ACP methyl ester carboxylesterase
MTAETLPLVLLPGYMLDETLWDDVAGKLGAPVQRMRLEPGKDLDEIAQGIGQRAPERFVLVGFSLGGYVARKVAELYPQRVAALILIATSLRDDTEERATSRRTLVRLMKPDTFRGLSTHSIASSLHPDLQGDKALLNRIRAMGERLGYQALVTQTDLRRDGIAAATLSCPTLVIAAAQDQLRSAEESAELAAAIPGARLSTIDNSGHLIPIEQPDVLAATIRDWLSSLQL